MESKFQSWIISLFLFPLICSADSISFDNTIFSIINFHTDSEKIIKQGDASIGGDGVLQLTINQIDNNNGRALYYQQLHLWDNETNNVADFNTSFSFSIDSENRDTIGDGMTFFLTNQAYNSPASFGSDLGIRNGYTNSTDPPSFVAVEFDTFANLMLDTKDGPHIGIDLNSTTSVTTDLWLWNNIRQGGGVHALITYDASTMNLSALLIDDNTLNSSRVSSIVNLKKLLPETVYFGFSASTGSFSEIHKITSWDFSSRLEVATLQVETNQTTPTGSGGESDNWIWIVASLSTFVMLVAAGVTVWFCKRRRSRQNQNQNQNKFEEDEDLEMAAAGPKKFAYKDLVEATNNFAEEKLLGEGGFGKVYEGVLATTRSHVAIKKINSNSSQGFKEYAAEIKTLSQLRHRNLVPLIGWCHREKELLLVYMYMSNGSLDAHLFERGTPLKWETRYRIAQDLASTLLYLHEGWEQCVLHRDIKVRNIMLDSSFNAKLGDFGLARLTDHEKGSQTTRLAGTWGYMAPECLSGRASKESDVYSFGIVLLEIASGSKVLDPRGNGGNIPLVDWVWDLYVTGNLIDAADPKLGVDIDRAQVERMMVVGLWCAHPNYLVRPPIRKALSSLKFDSVPPTLHVAVEDAGVLASAT